MPSSASKEPADITLATAAGYAEDAYGFAVIDAICSANRRHLFGMPHEDRDWDLGKWTKRLAIPNLKVESEDDLLEWEQACGSAVAALKPPLSVFVRIVSEQDCWLGRHIESVATTAPDLETLCDAIAHSFAFPRTRVAQREAEINTIAPQPTVTAAERLLTTKLLSYRRLCERHLRRSCFGGQRLAELLVQALPAGVSRQLACNQQIYRPWAELIQLGRYYESRFPPSSRTVFVAEEEMLPSRPPPRPCPGCGQHHWKKDCPDKNVECAKCHSIGHRSIAAPT